MSTASLVTGSFASKLGRCVFCVSSSTAAASLGWVAVAAGLVNGVGLLPLVGLLFIATSLSSLVLLHAVAYTLRRRAPAAPGSVSGCGCRAQPPEGV